MFWQKIGIDSSSKANALYITSGGNIWVGSGETTDKGAVFLTTNQGSNWTKPYDAGGPGVSAVLVIDNNNILIGTGSGLTGVIKRTTNGGSSWPIVNTLGLMEVVSSFVSTSAGIFVSTSVYSGNTGRILFSSDAGATWNEKSNSLGAIMAMSATSTGTLIAGNYYGDVYSSSDNGDNWTKIRTGADKDIGAIAVNVSGHIFIGVENDGFYRTTNNGAVWTQMSSGLGNKHVTAVCLANDTLFFVGTTLDGVYRSVNSGNGWTQVERGLGWKNVGNGALKVYNNYLYCGTGDGVYKSIRAATDIPAPPSPPKNLSAANGPRIVTLNWAVSDSANANVIYRIYRRTSETEFNLKKDNINSTSTSYVDSVRNDVQYYYYMTAYDNDKAMESNSTTTVAGASTLHDPVPPDDPKNLTATSGDKKVILRWNAVQASPVKYSVYRSTNSNQYSNALASSITSTSYTDNSVTNDIRYYYIVKAVNDTSSLESRASKEVSARPVKPNPEPPSNPVAAAIYPNIHLWWTKSITDDVTDYRIYKSKTSGVGYILNGTVTSSSNTFIDSDVAEDSTYYYVVRAWDGVHESDATGEVFAMVEKLRLKIDVTPSGKIKADRADLIVFEIRTKDQRGEKIQSDLAILNGITGSTDNRQTDAEGYFRFEYQIPVAQAFGEYSMSFTATKTNYESAVTGRAVIVLPIPRLSNDWAKVYSEAGQPQMIFAMADTNNKWFSPGDPGKVSNNGHGIVVNGYLHFTGTMTLDTIVKKINSTGKWFVYSSLSPPKEYDLLNGEVEISYLNQTLTPTVTEENIKNSTKLFGVTLYPIEYPDPIWFIGGLVAEGIGVNGYFFLPGIKGGCGSEPIDTIRFSNLIFEETGINMNQMTLPSLSPDPSACFSNLQAMYDATTDKLALYGDFTIPWLSVKGWGEVQGGNLSSINLYSARGEASIIGETGMSIRNVGGTVSGVNNPPMEMTLDGTIVSASPDYLEFDIGGNVSFPQKINFNASEARMLLEHTYNQWQIVGPMTGMMNITSHVDLDGDIKAGSIDGQNYVMEGKGQFKYQWSPEDRLRGGFKGDVTVTDFPDEFPYDILSMLWENEFPIQLHNTTLWFQDKKVMGNLNFGPLVGILNFTLDLDKVYGQEGFVTIGSGAQNLNGILRKDWDKKEKVQGFEPYKYEGQSLPMLQRKKEGTQAIANNDTLNLTGGMDKVYIRIMSDTQVPGSYLLDPNGGKHNSDDDPPKDTNVVFKAGANGKKGYWIIKGDFPSGQWIAGSDPDQTKPGDFRDVFATFDKRNINLVVTRQENDITATWNNTGMTDIADMEFYLALDTNDIKGLFIGTVKENVGTFNYSLSDTLPDCKYYLYILRLDGSRCDKYFSREELWNNKGNLMPPSVSSSVYYGSTKKLVINWSDPNTGNNIQGYLIRLTYTDGTQEIVARPYAGTTNIEIDIDIDYANNPTLKIELAAYTDKGYESCWSTELGVTVDVEDYPLAGFENGDDRLSLFPNPVAEATNIRFKVVAGNNVKISIYDLLGNEILVLADEYFDEGIYDIKLKTDKMLTGTYYIKYQSGDYTRTKLLVKSE